MTLLHKAATAFASVCLIILTALCLNIASAHAASPDPRPNNVRLSLSHLKYNVEYGEKYGPYKIAATGGREPYRYELQRTPPGITLNGDVIEGTFTSTGTYILSVAAYDADNKQAVEGLHIYVRRNPEIWIDPLPAGKIDRDYATVKLKAGGGFGPYTYRVSGLPAGLKFDNVDTISGKTTQSGTFPVSIHITDHEQDEITIIRDIVVAPRPDIDIYMHGGALPAGKQDQDYGSHRIVGIGSTGFTYSVTGLPEGISLSVDTVKGSAKNAGTYKVGVTATDKDGYFVTKSQDLLIASKPDIDIDLDTNRLPDGKQGLNYGWHKLVATGSTGFTFEVTGLPTGLKQLGNTVSGKPEVAGTFDVTIKATDKDGYVVVKSQDLTITSHPSIDIDLDANRLPDGKQGLDYGSHKLVATGSTGFTYVVTGLPTGLTQSGDTVSGTPVVAGAFSVTIKATDQDGYVVEKSQELTIASQAAIDIDLETNRLPDGKQGLDYGSHKLVATGSTGFTYEIDGLPTGLKLEGDTVSGIPTDANTFHVTVKATDKDGYSVTRSQNIIITPKSIIDLTGNGLPDGELGVKYSATINATGGTEPYSYVLSGLPEGLISSANSVTGTPVKAGKFNVSINITDADGYAATKSVQMLILANERPDPSLDAEVIGLVSAQVQTANRMAQMQIRNFQQRLEQLHGEGECRQDSIGLNVGLDGAQLNPKMAQVCTQRELSLWTAGEINMGKSSSEVNTKDKKLDHTSIGVSGGVDYRFSPSFIGGIGFGYGKDTTDVGENGTQSRANMFSLAAYGSYRPGKSFFLDGVVGYGWLNFESDRFVTATGGMASGERKGQQLFGSVTLGYDYRNEAWLFSPYIRGEAAHTKLNSFSETGAGIYNLTYGDQTADLLSATIGLRGEYTIPMSWGTLKPKARVEYTHDFAGNSRVKLGYTDIGGLLPYTIDANSTAKDTIRIEAGFDAMINGDWSAGLDYSTRVSSQGRDLSHGLRWKLSKQF